MKVFEFEMTIDPSQLDVLGHVNNAKYLEMLEAARWDLAFKSGINLKESIAKNKLAAVMLEINIKFRKEIKGGDHIKVISNYVSHTHKVFQVEQKITNEKGDVCAIAMVTLAPFSIEQRKIAEMPADWLKAFASSKD
jgi:thioesterase-3